MFQITGSIILYKNNPATVKRAISSYLNTNLIVKLFIIDNSPTNGASKIFNDKRVEYLFNNGNNVGFGTGHNIAIKLLYQRSKYHLVLNPDVYFNPFVMENIYKYMEQNKDVGLLMPKVLYLDGSIQYLCKLLPTPFELLFRRISPFKSIREKRNVIYELRFTNYDKIMEVPCLSGCFMFIRTEVLKKVNMFDERFFMYLEDTDLSRRIHKHYKTVYYPKVFIYHKYDKGSYRNFKLLYYHLISAIKYFNKWGWFFDKERKEINKRILENLKYLKPIALSRIDPPLLR